MLKIAHSLVPLAIGLCAACGESSAVITTDDATGTASSSSGGPTTGTTATSEPTSGPTTSAYGSESVGDTSTASTSGTSGDTSSGATTVVTTATTADTSTGDDTDSTGGVMEPPKSCTAAELPYMGPLCGGSGPACEVRLDELVDLKPTFRNDAPALALGQDCQPHIVYSVAEGGYHGFYARRALGGVWTTAPTPMPVATVGLVIDPLDGVPRAVTDDGAYKGELYRYSDDAWNFEATILGQTLLQARGVALDDLGRIVVAILDDPDELKLGVYTDGWDFTALAAMANAPAVAASPVPERAHVAAWSSQGGTWKAIWHAPPDGPETITTYGSNALERNTIAIAVAPSDDDAIPDVPHVLVATLRKAGGHQLVLAYRDEPGPWNVEVVAEETPETDTFCSDDPQSDGESCEYQYSEVRPLAAVASRGGDVRFFWTRVTYTGTLLSECVIKPNNLCTWKPQLEERSADLFVGWRGKDGPESAILTAATLPRSATAAIDSTGEVHLALYDQVEDGTTVRYLRVGG